jgi:hypothetical protein
MSDMDLAIKTLKHTGLFVLAAIMAIVGLCFFWMLAVLYFKITGRLVDGPMNYDGMTTPGYPQVAITLVACATVIGVCLGLRHLIKRTMVQVSA